MSFVKFALITGVIAVIAAASTNAQEVFDLKTSLSRMSALAYTEAFPEVDRIELCTLKIDREQILDQTKIASVDKFKISRNGGFGSADIYFEVDGHTTVDGKKCKEVADAWRTLTFQPNGALCHTPPYGVRFYRNNELLFETTVCWECHNFYMPQIDARDGELNHTLYGFRDDSHSKKLLSMFQKLLPLPKRKQKPK